jgi:hypothetical protein
MSILILRLEAINICPPKRKLDFLSAVSGARRTLILVLPVLGCPQIVIQNFYAFLRSGGLLAAATSIRFVCPPDISPLLAWEQHALTMVQVDLHPAAPRFPIPRTVLAADTFRRLLYRERTR